MTPKHLPTPLGSSSSTTNALKVKKTVPLKHTPTLPSNKAAPTTTGNGNGAKSVSQCKRGGAGVLAIKEEKQVASEAAYEVEEGEGEEDEELLSSDDEGQGQGGQGGGVRAKAGA